MQREMREKVMYIVKTGINKNFRFRDMQGMCATEDAARSYVKENRMKKEWGILKCRVRQNRIIIDELIDPRL